MSEQPDDPQGRALVKAIADEIATMHYAGDVRGIACAIVDREGDVRTLIAFGKGAKMPLIAGCAILQHSAIAGLAAIDKRRDYDD